MHPGLDILFYPTVAILPLLLLLLILCKSYQDDGKKTNIKLCAIEQLLDLYMYYMYQGRGR